MQQLISVKVKSLLGSKAILILMGILVPLLIIEVATHLIPNLIPLEFRSVFQHEQDRNLKGLTLDEELGYKHAPGLVDYLVPFEDNEAQNTYSISTVSLGYDDAGFRDDGIDDEPFAIVIGDSYVACASVEMHECWVELLESEVGKDFANLGVPSYGPQQEQRMLAKYGLPLKPKLVLWIFFPNDLNDAWRFDQFGTGAAREGKFWENPLRAWLARNSVIYTTFSFFWYNRYLYYNVAKADDETISHATNLVWWLTYTDLSIPDVAEGFTLTQAAILEANRQTQTKGSGTRFVVVILPFREQVYANATLQPRFDSLNDKLADFLRQNEIPVIDLTAALREEAKIEPDLIYFDPDIHLNARGNEIVAELLKPELEIILTQ